MTYRVKPWILAAFATPLLACGGATVSTPPTPLETDSGIEDGGKDVVVPIDDDASSDAASEIADAAGDVAKAVECPGWIEPDETASCSQNAMNNQCSANCRSGTRNWRSQCQDGTCTCSIGIEAKCTCEMDPGGCKSCCPGMAR